MAPHLSAALFQLLGNLESILEDHQVEPFKKLIEEMSDEDGEFIVTELKRSWPRILAAHQAYSEAAYERFCFSPTWTFGWVLSPTPSIGNIVLIGIYVLQARDLAYWRRVLLGNQAGYAVFVHERVEIEWYLNFNHEDAFRRLNPFTTLGRSLGYDDAHPTALIFEHLYWKSVAREDGYDNFTLEELIRADPQSRDPDLDWTYVEQLDANYGPDLDGISRGTRRVDEAKKWYRQRQVWPVDGDAERNQGTRGFQRHHPSSPQRPE
jgi:hypothetical protein